MRRGLFRKAMFGMMIGLLASQALRTLRRRPHAIRDTVIRFNHSLLNPLMLRFAGKGTFYASVIHHLGRRSGKAYATPVVAEPVADGFLIPLPYGSETDWCRNVLANGSASIDRKGERFAVAQPVVIDGPEGLALLPVKRHADFRSIKHFLRLKTAAPASRLAEVPSAAPGLATPAVPR